MTRALNQAPAKVRSHLAVYRDAAWIEDWFARAGHGATVAFARGAVKDAAHPSQLLVETWAGAGEVSLHLGRCRQTGDCLRLVRRVWPGREQDRAGADVSSLAARIRADEAWRETARGRVFLALVRAANLGQPCPGNAALADAAGIGPGPKAVDKVRYALRLLKQEGRIRIENSAADNTVRRVQIIETGRWTK